MSQVMSYKDWMKFTDGGITSRRSTKLKDVDFALKKYDTNKSPANKEGVLKALIAWQISKGAGWKTSVRNKHNAVDNLYRQLTGNVVVPGDQRVALSHIRNESRAIVTNLFQGGNLVFRPGLMTTLAGNKNLARATTAYTIASVGKDVNTLSGNAISNAVGMRAPASGRTSQAAADLASNLFRLHVPPEIAADVSATLAKVMPNFMTELKLSCTPILGVAFSAGKVMYAAGKSAKATIILADAETHQQRTLSVDEPEAAFLALIRMLDREANQAHAGLARSMAEFGSKVATTLVDGGTATNTAISLTSSLVKLLILLRIVVRDVQEKNKANLILKKPVITAELFEACPLMGAYLICCAPTSVLVNTVLSADKFYQPGMMDVVERAVTRHIQPLRIRAQKLIHAHRMYIPELQNYPGVMKQNKKKLKQMLKQSGKSNMRGYGPDDFDSDVA